MLQRNFYSKLVLLADDHHDVREITANMIRSLGYNVLTFPTGHELIEFYENNINFNISYFFLDLVMPKIGGLHCAEKILTIDPEAKIIIYSGYPEHESLNKLKQIGIKDILAKPFRLEQLAKMVNSSFSANTDKTKLVQNY